MKLLTICILFLQSIFPENYTQLYTNAINHLNTEVPEYVTIKFDLIPFISSEPYSTQFNTNSKDYKVLKNLVDSLNIGKDKPDVFVYLHKVNNDSMSFHYIQKNEYSYCDFKTENYNIYKLNAIQLCKTQTNYDVFEKGVFHFDKNSNVLDIEYFRHGNLKKSFSKLDTVYFKDVISYFPEENIIVIKR